MLADSRVTTMLPVVDMNRARRFYQDKLGLKAGRERPNGEVVFELKGTTVALYPRREPTRADHTALSFEVKDIAAEVRDLSKLGVAFEEYDLPGLKTVNKVCVLGAEKAAWFKDTEGNILCIHEDLS
jgi:catechol 2,3-dioxygenase-like lactoylglutathione lyase family enzyme